MSSYAIGDLQGCNQQLQNLLDLIEKATPDAQFLFVGDLVNRGPQSLQTLRRLRELGSRAKAVLGNHDLHLLAVSLGIRPQHRTDTLGGILNAPDRDELIDRLRCIINTLTRMRFCTPDGGIDFKIKEGLDAAPPGYVPWFDMPDRQTADVTCVFGHWASLGLTLRPNLIGLDTGCVWGGKLTAIRLEDRALFQVECPRAEQFA